MQTRRLATRPFGTAVSSTKAKHIDRCIDCGVEFIRHGMKKRCPVCSDVAARKQRQDYAERKRAERAQQEETEMGTKLFEKFPDAVGGGGDEEWLSLKDDGDTAVIAVLPVRPVPRKLVYVDGKMQEWSDGFKAQGLKPSTKWTFMVANLSIDADGNKIQKWEIGNNLKRDLEELDKEYGLCAKSFKIKRNGAKGSNTTKYTALPKDDLPPQLQEKLEFFAKEHASKEEEMPF